MIWRRVITTRRHNRSLLRLAGVALYAAFLFVASFEHHDLACHLKNPQHCTACTASQLGTDPDSPSVVGAWQLSDAGCAVSFQPPAAGVLLPHQSTGRSPPVAFR
jgi:hypothetical protein